MRTRSDERRQMRCQEAALAVANERLFEQALELEALELANDEIIRQAGQAVQEVSMASSVCFIMTGFFAAWTQFYTVVQPNPGRAVVTAGMSLLAAWIGRRLHSRPAWLGDLYGQ